MRKIFFSIILSFLLFMIPVFNIAAAAASVPVSADTVLRGKEDDDDDSVSDDDDDSVSDDDGDDDSVSDDNGDDDDDEDNDGDDDDDDGDDDDDDGDDDGDDGQDGDSISDNDEIKDNPAPYETVEVRGYNYGYEEGKSDGKYDSALSAGSGEKRACQINDPLSLYSRIMDPKYTVSENDRIGYPKSLLPVSGNALTAYQKYAEMWQEGYRDGYNYSMGEAAETDWYERGYTFGGLDVRYDLYDPQYGHEKDGKIVQNGYYEPDYSDSLYNTLKGKYGDAYRAGYDAGWKDGMDSFTYGIDYSGSDMDPWRITTCPLNWDTADAYYVQTDPVISNAYFDVDTGSYMTCSGDPVMGGVAAYSPFAWFFSEDSTYIRNGEVVDRKYASLTRGVNTGVTSTENWLYRAVDAGDGLYILIRYRVGSMLAYQKMKVRRYYYSRENGNSGALIRTPVTDFINNYYNGNEPVAAFDSRKIVDMERRIKKGEVVIAANTKGKRREICADAVLVRWESGKSAEYLGDITLRALAKDNVYASVSSDNMRYLGDRYINGNEIEENRRYYRVSREEALDDEGQEKDLLEKVSFAGTQSIGKLTKEENSQLTGDGPVFTLKVKDMGKDIGDHKKAVAAALKNEEFRFEIARFNLVKKEDTGEKSEIFSPYYKVFTMNSDIAQKVYELKPAAPRRRDYDDYESFIEDVIKYNKDLAKLNEYMESDEYRTGFLKELEKARNEYMKEYRNLVNRYGNRMPDYAKYVTENELPEYVKYTYKKKYSEDYFKDGNKDGTVSEIEQWEYDNLYGPFVLNATDHYNFNGKFDAGENVIPDSAAYQADYNELPDFDEVGWLSGTSYYAVTIIYLDEASAGEFKAQLNSEPDMELPELNEDFFTYNADVKLALGKVSNVNKKELSMLRIKPSFVYYTGENSEGEYTRVSKRKIRISGKNTDISLSDKMAGDQAVLLLHGENNFEGDIALRLRSNGETGYGIWTDDNNNYIYSTD